MYAHGVWQGRARCCSIIPQVVHTTVDGYATTPTTIPWEMAQITKRHHDTGLFLHGECMVPAHGRAGAAIRPVTLTQKQVKFMMVADVLFLQHFPPFIVYVYVLVEYSPCVDLPLC